MIDQDIKVGDWVIAPYGSSLYNSKLTLLRVTRKSSIRYYFNKYIIGKYDNGTITADYEDNVYQHLSLKFTQSKLDNYGFIVDAIDNILTTNYHEHCYKHHITNLPFEMEGVYNFKIKENNE